VALEKPTLLAATGWPRSYIAKNETKVSGVGQEQKTSERRLPEPQKVFRMAASLL
jgi:hypothetical protein